MSIFQLPLAFCIDQPKPEMFVIPLHAIYVHTSIYILVWKLTDPYNHYILVIQIMNRVSFQVKFLLWGCIHNWELILKTISFLILMRILLPEHCK